MDVAARFEFKYVLSADERAALRARFAPRLLPDAVGAPDGRYPVVSLYCDTPDRRCHWEAWRGVPSRRKLRLRLYGSPDGASPPACFLEVKHRDGAESAKRRVALPLADALAVLAGGEAEGADAAARRTLAEIGRLVRDDGFRPACVIRYDREALRFVDDAGRERLRVTFDEGVRARFDRLVPAPADDACGLPVLPDGLCLMEIKGAEAVPYELAAWLTARGIYPRPFSKYSESIRRSAPETASR